MPMYYQDPQREQAEKAFESVTAEDGREINREIRTLMSRLDFLKSALDSLHKRLSPIMQETQPDSHLSNTSPPASTEIGRAIRVAADRVGSLSDEVIITMERLELD